MAVLHVLLHFHLGQYQFLDQRSKKVIELFERRCHCGSSELFSRKLKIFSKIISINALSVKVRNSTDIFFTCALC